MSIVIIMSIVSEKVTLHFNNHFQCYEVVTPHNPKMKVAYVKDFACYFPLSQSKPFGIRTRGYLRYDVEVK